MPNHCTDDFLKRTRLHKLAETGRRFLQLGEEHQNFGALSGSLARRTLFSRLVSWPKQLPKYELLIPRPDNKVLRAMPIGIAQRQRSPDPKQAI